MYQMNAFFQSCYTVILLISVHIRNCFLPRITSINLDTAQEPSEFKFLSPPGFTTVSRGFIIITELFEKMKLQYSNYA